MQNLNVHIKIFLCTVDQEKNPGACSQLHQIQAKVRSVGILWQARIQLDMHREVCTIRARSCDWVESVCKWRDQRDRGSKPAEDCVHVNVAVICGFILFTHTRG